jgi:hypothetical protein
MHSLRGTLKRRGRKVSLRAMDIAVRQGATESCNLSGGAARN